MDVVDPIELMEGFRRVELCTVESISLRGVLDDIRHVRARLDHVEAKVAKRLKEASGTPERDVSKSAQRSNRHGHKVMARAAAIENEPTLNRVLEAGDLGGEHVDVFAKVLGSLDGPIKEGFAEAAPALIEAAANSGSTPEEFAASLHTAAEALASDGGMTRLERQRRNTRLRTWTDRATGMWHLSGAFDPESGVILHGRLEAAMSAMFATKTPSTAPTHPGDKQDHLRALALLALTNGGPVSSPSSPFAPDGDQSDEWSSFGEALGSNLVSGGKRFGKPEITLVLDTTNLGPDGRPTADWGIPVTIPWERIKRLCHAARIRPVVIDDGNVIDADGELNLGRTSRLANRAQRRALHAVYATCAVPGCNVSFNHTKPHHLHWWRHGGPTDFANLLPLCSQHHHCAHEGGWLFTLGPNRELTIELPDGQIMRTGPPNRKAAA